MTLPYMTKEIKKQLRNKKRSWNQKKKFKRATDKLRNLP
jgi:hypothetical protein